MILLLRLCFVISLLLLLGTFAVFALCIESTPLVAEQAQLSPAHIDRVKEILRQYKPGNLRNGETKTISISEKELNLLATYLARRLNSVGTVLRIKQGQLALSSSWNLSAFLPNKQLVSGYINIEAIIASSLGKPGIKGLHIHSLRIGQISIPSPLIEALIQFSLARFDTPPGLLEGIGTIQSVDIRPQHIALTYQWRDDLVEIIRGGFIRAEERQALAIYNQFLVSEVDQQGRELTFNSLLEATFRFAQARSEHADPVAENRAAIIVFAAYVNGGGLSTLVAEARDWPKPRRAKLRLHGRHDLVLHFTTSAALAVAGGGAMSNAIGLRKEIDDAHSGSGFSFKDLAADRAGSRFGELAVTSRASARALQQRLAQGQGKKPLLPSLQGLQEKLGQTQFLSRYGGVNDLRYQRVVTDIDERINALALYRDMEYRQYR